MTDRNIKFNKSESTRFFNAKSFEKPPKLNFSKMYNTTTAGFRYQRTPKSFFYVDKRILLPKLN